MSGVNNLFISRSTSPNTQVAREEGEQRRADTGVNPNTGATVRRYSKTSPEWNDFQQLRKEFQASRQTYKDIAIFASGLAAIDAAMENGHYTPRIQTPSEEKTPVEPGLETKIREPGLHGNVLENLAVQSHPGVSELPQVESEKEPVHSPPHQAAEKKESLQARDSSPSELSSTAEKLNLLVPGEGKPEDSVKHPITGKGASSITPSPSPSPAPKAKTKAQPSRATDKSPAHVGASSPQPNPTSNLTRLLDAIQNDSRSIKSNLVTALDDSASKLMTDEGLRALYPGTSFDVVNRLLGRLPIFIAMEDVDKFSKYIIDNIKEMKKINESVLGAFVDKAAEESLRSATRRVMEGVLALQKLGYFEFENNLSKRVAFVELVLERKRINTGASYETAAKFEATKQGFRLPPK
jgi:hypothetical protein